MMTNVIALALIIPCILKFPLFLLLFVIFQYEYDKLKALVSNVLKNINAIVIE